jgi:hypothetical protein
MQKRVDLQAEFLYFALEQSCCRFFVFDDDDFHFVLGFGFRVLSFGLFQVSGFELHVSSF